jgi:hypothetical protein
MEISSRVRGVRRNLVVAAAGLLAAASLAACSPDQLGAAAIVDGNVISTDTLQSSARAYLVIVPNADRTQVQQRILERMILSRVIAKVAGKEDVKVSTGTIAKQRDQLLKSTKSRKGLVAALAQQTTPVVVPPSYIDQWVRDQLLFRKVVIKLAGTDDPTSAAATSRATSALAAAGKTMKITINPRFGTWNPNTGVQALVSGGLAKTAAQLTAQK